MQVAELPPSCRPKEAARILSVGEATIWRWVAERKDFPRPRRLSNKCTVFDTAELMAWRDAQGVKQ
jgi:prophage regulatory protein